MPSRSIVRTASYTEYPFSWFMKRWYTIDPIQGAKDAITWNVGKYGMEIDSYGNNQGIEAKMQIKGIDEKKAFKELP